MKHPNVKRRTRAMIGATALVAAFAIADSSPVDAQQVTAARVDGENRYDTARQLAPLDFPTAPAAFLALGEDFPDALAISYAAGAAGGSTGPILLTRRDSVPDETLAALTERQTEQIYVVGGPMAISNQVVADLEAVGFDVDRVEGADRYGTAAAVALEWAFEDPDAVGTLDGQRTALLASGEDFPDALAAGPVAAGASFPLLLTPPNAINESVGAALQELEIERIVIVGGESAVSAEVAAFYGEAYEIERWAGDNRRETAIAVADQAIARLGFDPALTLLARGDNFPDALAASVHAGMRSAPILLTQSPTQLGAETEAWFEDRCPDIRVIRALGGTAAVSTGVLEAAIIAAADACPNVPSYVIEPAELVIVDPGTEQEFQLTGTYDGGPLTAGELALFPCAVVETDGSVVTFNAGPDGFADLAGQTDTASAWISQINDVEQTEGQNRDRGFDPDGYSFHVTSDDEDCAVVVVWDTWPDGAQNDQLPLDDFGAPNVRFGIGVIVWIDGENNNNNNNNNNDNNNANNG